MHCSKFGKRPDSDSDLDWQIFSYIELDTSAFLVILIPHLSPVVVLRLGKNRSKFSKWRCTCTHLFL